MDYFDYISRWFPIGEIILIVGSIIYAFQGIIILFKKRHFISLLTFITFLIAYPFLFNLVLRKSSGYEYFLLIEFPVIIMGIVWIMSGFFIRKHAEKVEDGNYIVFYKDGKVLIRIKGLVLTLTSIVLWLLLYLNVIKQGFLFMILSLHTTLQFYWGTYLLITGKEIDDKS